MKELVEDPRWVAAPSPDSPAFWGGIAAGVLLLVLAAGAWWFWRRRRASSAAPSLPPHLVALEELARLRATITPDDFLAFIVEVSRILRAYIQDRFGLRAPHRSTEEFLMEAAGSPELNPGQQSLLGDFLRQCDLVKFARRQAALERMHDLLDTATRFVQDTIPSPVPPAPAPAP